MRVDIYIASGRPNNGLDLDALNPDEDLCKPEWHNIMNWRNCNMNNNMGVNDNTAHYR